MEANDVNEKSARLKKLITARKRSSRSCTRPPRSRRIMEKAGVKRARRPRGASAVIPGSPTRYAHMKRRQSPAGRQGGELSGVMDATPGTAGGGAAHEPRVHPRRDRGNRIDDQRRGKRKSRERGSKSFAEQAIARYPRGSQKNERPNFVVMARATRATRRTQIDDQLVRIKTPRAAARSVQRSNRRTPPTEIKRAGEGQRRAFLFRRQVGASRFEEAFGARPGHRVVSGSPNT